MILKPSLNSMLPVILLVLGSFAARDSGAADKTPKREQTQTADKMADELVSHSWSKPVKPDPNDARWKNIPPFEVALQPQAITTPRGGGSVKAIRVRIAHTQKEIAFHLEWEDPKPDDLNGPDSYRDAVAIQFPVSRSETAPSPFMGDKENPVNIWQWRADWQAKADGKKTWEKSQPQTAGVFASHTDEKVLKKQFPDRHAPDAAAMEFIAAGWGTLTAQGQQDVQAKGVYENGKWKVVFTRSLERSDASDAEFPILPKGSNPSKADSTAGKSGLVTFACWEGSQGDVNGMKSVSMAWIPFHIGGK